jgi:hypothetical protein
MQAAVVRQQLAPSWNRWHELRTAASIAALALLPEEYLSPAAPKGRHKKSPWPDGQGLSKLN